MVGDLRAELHGQWGRALGNYVIFKDGSYIKGYNPLLGRVVYTGTELGVVGNYLKNLLTAGGLIQIREGVYPQSTPIYHDINYLAWQGAFDATQIVPSADIDSFIIRPCISPVIKDLYINDGSGNQTSTGGIKFDWYNGGSIYYAILENINMYNTYNGIYSPAHAGDISNSIFLATIRNINANSYRGTAYSLYNFYDTALLELQANQKTIASLNAFEFYNSSSSGNFGGKNLKALGKGTGTTASAFFMNNVTDMYFVNTLADSYNINYNFSGTFNRNVFTAPSSYSSITCGILANQTTGINRFRDHQSISDNVYYINTGGGGTKFRGGLYSSAFGPTFVPAQFDSMENVDGYNPQAASTPAVGASPVTFGPYVYPAMIEISGGTITSTTIRTLASTEKTGLFMLYPGDTCVIVYTVAPTVKLWPQ